MILDKLKLIINPRLFYKTVIRINISKLEVISDEISSKV